MIIILSYLSYWGLVGDRSPVGNLSLAVSAFARTPLSFFSFSEFATDSVLAKAPTHTPTIYNRVVLRLFSPIFLRFFGGHNLTKDVALS